MKRHDLNGRARPGQRSPPPREIAAIAAETFDRVPPVRSSVAAPTNDETGSYRSRFISTSASASFRPDDERPGVGRAAMLGLDMGMWQEFKEFALKGNALSLAVGVIIGAAFGKIVDALVNDLIMPIVGIAGKADFSNYYIPLSSAVTATNLADARKQGGVLAYGDFISVVINFAIVAVALFVVIKGINILNRADKAKPAEPPPPSPEVVLLTEIRDQLAKRGA